MAMQIEEKVARIQQILNQLYPNPQPPLAHEDAYTLLIAVLLSARCTDVRVNQITPLLFARAKTPEAMVKLSVDEIQEIIRPCGLSQAKALAIHTLSNLLVAHYDHQVPPHFEALESLPGVGHKTASVVMSQAFGEPAFPVDTHIHRCAARWGLSSGKSVKQTEVDLKRLFPKKDWGKLHLQIIYFARQYCRALKHHRTQCPICSWAT